MDQESPQPTRTSSKVPATWQEALTHARSPLKTVRFKAVSTAPPTGPGDIPAFASRRSLAGAQADFQLLEEVGKGGMGVVYKGLQASLGRLVAVKRAKARLVPDPETALRFLREAELTGRLEHPNIIPVHDLGQDEAGDYFYTMKLVDGHPWSQRMRQLDLQANLEILQRVMDAVAFAHSRGVVHRDLKPENVMLGEFGEVYVWAPWPSAPAGSCCWPPPPAAACGPGAPAPGSPCWR